MSIPSIGSRSLSLLSESLLSGSSPKLFFFFFAIVFFFPPFLPAAEAFFSSGNDFFLPALAFPPFLAAARALPCLATALLTAMSSSEEESPLPSSSEMSDGGSLDFATFFFGARFAGFFLPYSSSLELSWSSSESDGLKYSSSLSTPLSIHLLAELFIRFEACFAADREEPRAVRGDGVIATSSAMDKSDSESYSCPPLTRTVLLDLVFFFLAADEAFVLVIVFFSSENDFLPPFPVFFDPLPPPPPRPPPPCPPRSLLRMVLA